MIKAELNPEADHFLSAISTQLRAELNIISLKIIDDSAKHRSHIKQHNLGEYFLSLHIEATDFQGLTLVQRHKLVYRILADYLPNIHALQLFTT